MFEFRSKMAASAVTVALGLSLLAVAPAVAADKAPAAKTSAVKKKATKNKATKKKAKKKAAAPKTVTACVITRTGATKVLLGKKAKRKCAKGWTKMTWSVAGPKGADGKNGANGVNGLPGATGLRGAQGLTGANGQPLAVRDATGKRIGGFGGYFVLGYPFSLLQVIADDGGVYSYLDTTGQLFPFSMIGGSGSPVFQDAACAGPAYLELGGSGAAELAMLVGGSFRIVYRSIAGMSTFDLGPTRAWKLTATTSVVPPVVPAMYELDPAGACTMLTGGGAPVAGDNLVSLESVIAPPDGVGPLTVG